MYIDCIASSDNGNMTGAVGADHIDELGMFITKLALDFQLTAGGDPPLSHALLAEEQGVADADALMSGSIATGLKGKDASKMRKASMKPPVLVRKGSTNSMMNNMLTVADKNDARGRRKSCMMARVWLLVLLHDTFSRFPLSHSQSPIYHRGGRYALDAHQHSIHVQIRISSRV